MTKVSPFAGTIALLNHQIATCKRTTTLKDYPCSICAEHQSSIRVLEAAGKVDPSALETFMEMVCEPRDIWEEARVKEIRTLLSALPDKEPK
jgi:hypothetical protein